MHTRLIGTVKVLIAVFIVVTFFFLSPRVQSPIQAADPGCSSITPNCVGSAVVDTFLCHPPVAGLCDSSDDGLYMGQVTRSCVGSPNCRFQWCSSNDLPLNCISVGGGCLASNCTTSGNCCAGPPEGTPVCGDGSCNGTETCSSCSADCGSCSSCTATNPTAVTLSTPTNGAVVTTSPVTLSWNPTASWGTGCPQNNLYYVYLDTVNPPTTLLTTESQAMTSHDYAWSTAGTKYWRVRTSNGSNTANSPVWSFTTSLGGPTPPPAGSGYYFDLKGDGGYPGIPAYKDTTNLTSANVSEEGWLAHSGYNPTKIYNSAYFINAIPADLVPTLITDNPLPDNYFASHTGTTDSGGNEWFEFDPSIGSPNYTIQSEGLGSKKVILFARNGDVNLTGPITLTKGQGSFLLITTGNIIVDPTVGSDPASVTEASPANLEGIFVSDGQFRTGTTGTSSDLQLRVRGSIAAYGGASLQRNLGTYNPDAPAEFFEFAPDLALQFPSILGVRNMNWQEVAP